MLPGALPLEQVPENYRILAQQPLNTAGPGFSPAQQNTIRFSPGYGYVQGGYDPQAQSAVLRGLEGPRVADSGGVFKPSNAVQAQPQSQPQTTDLSNVPSPPARPAMATEAEAIRELRRLYPAMTPQVAKQYAADMAKRINAFREKDYELARHEYDDNMQRLKFLLNQQSQDSAADIAEARAELLKQKVLKGQAEPDEYARSLSALQQLRLSSEMARKQERAAFEELTSARDLYNAETAKWYKPFSKPSQETLQRLQQAEAAYNEARDAYKQMLGIQREEQARFVAARQNGRAMTNVQENNSAIAQPSSPNTAKSAPSLSGGPPVGYKYGGYRFKGGDWRDRNNWEKISGGK
jgi:hypothetical protein